MSFKFRLQRILELREQHEKAKARELASAQRVSESAHSAKDEIAALRDDSKTHIEKTASEAPRVGHLQQLGLVLDSLDARVILATEAAKLADADVQKAQGVLEDAVRDRRILDRLKDRHAETYSVETAQQDRVQMSAIALVQFSRKTVSNAADDAATDKTPIDGSRS